jgi:hypothetical protein
MSRKNKNKGNSYERDICDRLSIWFSDGSRDDLFWKSSNSGGRATNRAKKGKTAQEHQGDVTWTHPKGRALIELVTIELKKGYPKAHIGQIVDRPTSINLQQQQFEEFIEQVVEAKTRAKTPFWWLIHKRDRREEMVYFNHQFYKFLLDCASLPLSYTYCVFPVRWSDKSRRVIKIYGCRLSDLLDYLKPLDLKEFYKRERTNR